MTTRQTTPSRPKGSGDQVHDFQAICQRVVDNAYAERAALAARPRLRQWPPEPRPGVHLLRASPV